LKVLNNILKEIEISWRKPIEKALFSLDDDYLEFLQKDKRYFPDIYNFLNPFKTLGLNSTKYILFGQDPYPRKESAIGYAFIDAKVKNIFSSSGFSKEVNKATSLRNFIKMLLVCENILNPDDLSQTAISNIEKTGLCQNMLALKDNFEKNGVLLLNTALIFTDKKESKYHLKKWKPFVETLLSEIENRDIKLIFFGEAAKNIEKIKSVKNFKKFKFIHPYNIEFIKNEKVHKLFKPMNLMKVQY